MAESKMIPTKVPVDDFLSTVDTRRKEESLKIIDIMHQVSGEEPVMWGPSIIGFGSMSYEYPSGRKGIMPILGFSPRKASLTIYTEGFDDYADLLKNLGKHKVSVACLYINKLDDVDLDVLALIIQRSYKANTSPNSKPRTIEEYLGSIPQQTKSTFDHLRKIVISALPRDAHEAFDYGIVGYKLDNKRARVYISGWKDHVAIYPVPNDKDLLDRLKPYIAGKGTIKFPIEKELPKELIVETVNSLVDSASKS